MGKISNNKFLMVVGAIVLCLLITLFVGWYFRDRTIVAYIAPLDIECSESIQFSDSTRFANTWFWEFGNGDSSHERNGSYVFKQSGKYQVRLTVNGKYEKRFIVNVRDKVKGDENRELIKIIAPGYALQNEIIAFHAIGNSKEWRWQFGETGMVDSRDKNPLYAFTEPGMYEITLMTEDTHYPILHTIQIDPNYQKNDSTDVLTLVGNDIRGRLQSIVDGNPFNTNYNYVLNTYLCGNPDVIVTINNQKRNDFYSYCQGLRIIGRQQLIIESVIVDIGGEESDECVKQLMITQYDKYSSR